MKLTFKRSGFCGRGTKLHYSIDGGERNVIDKNAVCEIPSGHHALDVMMHIPLTKDIHAHVDIPEVSANENVCAVVSISMRWWLILFPLMFFIWILAPIFAVLWFLKPAYEIRIRFDKDVK